MLCRHSVPRASSRQSPRRCFFIKQLRKSLMLLIVESGDKPFPEALLRVVPDAADKALEHVHPRKNSTSSTTNQDVARTTKALGCIRRQSSRMHKADLVSRRRAGPFR